MRVAYGKLGRVMTWGLDKYNPVGGDIEHLNILKSLIADGHEVHIVTQSRGELPAGVVDHTRPGGCLSGNRYSDEERKFLSIEPEYWPTSLVQKEKEKTEKMKNLPKFDAWVIWTGPNSTSRPIPLRGKPEQNTTPLVYAINYVRPIMDLMEMHHAGPIWLCPDVRNPLLMRDGQPHLFKSKKVLAQYDYKRNLSLIDDSKISLQYSYAALELAAVLLESRVVPVAYKDRTSFGVIANEGHSGIKYARKNLVRDWILKPLGPVEIRGIWKDESVAELGITPPTPVPVFDVLATLGRWRSTITFPVHDSGWATAKAWESFAAGTPCFAHPKYDSQNHIYGQLDEKTRDFLRPSSPEALAQRVEMLDKDENLWNQIVAEQLATFDRVYKETLGGYKFIKEELSGK